MKRLLTTCMLLVAVLYCCHAQGVRRWSEGLPDWNGFEVADVTDSVSSYASFSLVKDSKVVRTPEATYRYIGVTGVLLPYQSRVRSDSKTEAELESIRREFDILEYFARQYQDYLLFATDGKRLLEKYYISRFQEAREAARRTGDYSKYPLSDEPFDILDINFIAKEEYLGVSFGLFANQPFGDQGRLLFPTAGASLGFELGQGRNALQTEFNLGMGFYRLQLYDLIRKPVPYLSLFAAYRRELLDAGKWRMSLYGGPGFTLRRFQHIDNSLKTVGGPALCEGICADLHTGRNIIFGVPKPIQSDSFVRLKLSLSQTYNLAQKKVVPAVTFSAGIHFQNHAIDRL